MSQGPSASIHEEDQNENFYMKYLNSKVRNNQKKLKQIDQLQLLEALNADQQKKVDNRSNIEKTVEDYQKMITEYKSAEKEYGIKRQQGDKKQKVEKFKQEETIVVDTISFMMDIQYLAQYFNKGQLAPELQQYHEQITQIKQLYKRCFRLAGGRSLKLHEKLEQAKNIMVSVMYQEKEWKGITQNVKMLIKKDCVANMIIGDKPSRKASSAVQRKMSNKQAAETSDEKKVEKEVEEKKTQEPQKKEQQKKEEPKEEKVEEKPVEKKYVLTKVEPESLIQRNRSKSNKKDDKPKEIQKPRKVTFDETNIKQADQFIEVKTRTQKKKEQPQQQKRSFEKKKGPKYVPQQKKEFHKERPAKQIIQYVVKEQQKQEQEQSK